MTLRQSGSYFPALLLSGLLLLSSAHWVAASPPPGAQESIQVYLVTETLLSPDGHAEVRERIWDPETERLLPLSATRFAGAEIRHEVRAAKVKLQKLGVKISDRWADEVQARQLRGTNTYRGAADLTSGQRGFARDVMDDLVNPNLGHVQTPMLTTTNADNVPFRGPAEFGGNPFAAEAQYTFDGINEAGRDDENVLFTSEISNPHDPVRDAIIRGLRMSSGSCSMKAGRWFCPMFLIESDVFFRSRQTIDQGRGDITIRGFFEDVDLIDQQILLTSTLKFNQGHNSDAWQHSVQSGRREVGVVGFGDFNNNVWQEIRDGDDLLYGNPDTEERLAARTERFTAILRPLRDAMISVNELEPPAISQNLNEAQNLNRFEQFAETNLRGHIKKKKLVVDFFEGDSQKKSDRIVRLSGFAVNRQIGLNDGSMGDAAYRASHLYIGRSKDWKKIRDRVRDNGEVDVIIHDTPWDRALMVTVCVTGREIEGGPKSKVCERYYYGYQLPG